MLWNQYLAETGHAVQKGLSNGLHLLEGGLATAATLKGSWELASAIGTGMRDMAAAAGPAAAVALL